MDFALRRVGTKEMDMIADIVEWIKRRLGKGRETPLPQHDDRFYDTASDGEDGSAGNPIVDLYNRAVTHPATTIGLIAAVVGVGAAVAFVLAEQRAQKGIAREVERESQRAKKRLKSWTADEILPRVRDYRRKSPRLIRRWRKH